MALTAFDTELFLIQMINKGVNGYLLKSCDPLEIKRALISIYKNGYYYGDPSEEQFFREVRVGNRKLPHFTDNELEFLTYCPSELTYNEIAKKMGTSVRALDGYIARLSEKLQVNGKVSLAMYATASGLVMPEFKKKILTYKNIDS